MFFLIFASLVATAPQSIPRGEIPNSYPCFISFLKPFRVLIIEASLPGKGKRGGGAWGLGNDYCTSSIQGNFSFLELLLTLDSQMLIKTFIQYGKMNGLFHSLSKLEHGIINPWAFGFCSSLQRALSCLVIFSNVAPSSLMFPEAFALGKVDNADKKLKIHLYQVDLLSK